MIVYVAGGISDFEKVRDVQEALIEAGHVISYDWTSAAPDAFWRKETDDVPSEEYLREQAELDRQGAVNCEALVFVVNEKVLGAYIEIGMALAMGNTVYLLGKPERQSVFFRLPEVRVREHVDEILGDLALQEEQLFAAYQSIAEMANEKENRAR